MNTSSSLPMGSDGVVGFQESNPAMDGGDRTEGKRSMTGDGCTSPRRKRAREAGEDEEPAPAKRMPPTSPRRHNGRSFELRLLGRVSPSPSLLMESDGVVGFQGSIPGMDGGRSTGGDGSCSGNGCSSPRRKPAPEAEDEEPAPAKHTSPLQQFLLDWSYGVSGNDGGGDCALPLPLLLPPPDGEFSRTPHESLRGLVGDRMGSSCWDGGCAGRSPPGGGGGLSAPPAACLSPLFSARETDEVSDLGVFIPDIDIAECMATLQATPTDFPCPKTSVPPSSARNPCNDAGGCGADDSGVDVGEEEEEEEEQEKEQEQEEQSGGCDRGGVTMRIGDLYQAAIPDLKHREGVVDLAAMTTSLSLPMRSEGVVGFQGSNPAMDGGNRTEGKGSTNGEGCTSPRRKRAREAGEDEEPAPAKRMPPTSPRRHNDRSPELGLLGRGSPSPFLLMESDGVVGFQGSIPGMDGGRSTGGDGSCNGNGCSSPRRKPAPEAEDEEPAPAKHTSPLQQFLLDWSCDVSGNGGGGDCALPLPLLLPPPDGEFSRTPHESFQGLVGGRKGSSCWDGGCAGRSSPGGGGGLSALPAACLSPLFSARETDEVGDLGVFIPDIDIAECMATLQATPTKGFPYPKTLVSPNSARNPCNDAGGCGADDSGVDVGEEEEEEEEQEEEEQEEQEEEQEEQSGGCDRGGVTMRIGDLYQAAIPDLALREGVVNSPLARAPPLQLWRPGIVPERALDLAFPRPRREGAGSSDLEKKMMSAFLVARSSGFGRERCDGGGNGDPPLETLAEVAANGDGCSWKSDWPEQDKESFRKGVYAFRRDFGRIRESFLPHRGHAELVEFFYRHWKRNPEYSAWKNTDQLIGRRVAQRVGTNETRQGAGLGGKGFDDRGMRRGWVVRREVRDREKTFFVRFPPDGSSQATVEDVSIGVLETMLVEGSATDEERASEALDGDL